MKLPGEAWLEFKIVEKNGKIFYSKLQHSVQKVYLADCIGILFYRFTILCLMEWRRILSTLEEINEQLNNNSTSG